MNIVSFAVVAIALIAIADAKPQYRARLPNPDAARDSGMKCGPLGHNSCVPGAPRNQFALDFKAAGYNYTLEFCNKDSDGDGVSNGAELGDPCCVFKQNGTPPARSVDLSHPGEMGSMPVDPKNRQCNNPLPATTPTGNENAVAAAPVNSTRDTTNSTNAATPAATPSAPVVASNSAQPSAAATPSESPSAEPSVFRLVSSSPAPSLSAGASQSASYSPEPSTSVSATPTVSSAPSVSSVIAAEVAAVSPDALVSVAASVGAPTPAVNTEPVAAGAPAASPEVPVAVGPLSGDLAATPVVPGVGDRATVSSAPTDPTSAEAGTGVPANDPISLGSPVAVQSPFPADSAAATTAPQNSQATCFPAGARVTLYGGEKVSMDALKVGDRVQVGKDAYSEVVMFTHALPHAVNTFIAISSIPVAGGDMGKLELTPRHYLYANDKLVSAENVNVGDTLQGSDGAPVKVVGMQLARRTGLYNPQTAHGDIIVDGIRTSTYTETVDMKAAHALLAPFRAVFTYFGLSTSAFEKGVL